MTKPLSGMAAALAGGGVALVILVGLVLAVVGVGAGPDEQEAGAGAAADTAGIGGVTYDPTRLAIGLGVAVTLLAVAVWLCRHTDWRRPSEAATPELDAAVLGATDLD